MSDWHHFEKVKRNFLNEIWGLLEFSTKELQVFKNCFSQAKHSFSYQY